MRGALMLSALILSATSLIAHHNVEQLYDSEKPVPLNGIITAVEWKAPHVLVFVDSKDAAGSILNWKVELIGRLEMSREGFTRDLLHVGGPISMTACVAKDGSHNAAAQFITVPSAFENHRAGLCRAISR